MEQKTVNTFVATIYVGLKHKETGRYFDISELERICQEFCDEKGWCVTVTKTKYIYTGGWEHGAIIGIINYPRFPATKKQLVERTVLLAAILKKACQQSRVSIVFKKKTLMLSGDVRIKNKKIY